MTTAIRFEQQGHTAILTMDNPPANTWTAASLSALAERVAQLNADREIWSLVLTGAGDRFFSAGADLKLFADGDRAVAREMARRFGEAFEALSRFRGLSIAAIDGYAMGGGLEAALACDLRVAGRQAVMALPEAKVGLLPCAGGTQNLTWLVGEGWAKRLILCGERLDAERALAIGLVEEVVPQGQALDRALALARQAEQQSPSSLAACKRLIQSARSRPLAQGYIREREEFVDLFDTEDQREGVNAFLEKRPPQWRNR
ncbi:enoyl-CoA hydratase [Zobellella denitrificans]|uniref:Enoyl-CoA hydratase n=1 Tax=Zobellella denitrificans TaxID=347534 RepID=A0A291HSP7_9GAMM|nr:enoyl-CoA hydratase [Zobellella denitrificans]ATG75132.1 enoyl-CoA hydratase [Zobellella denitrificans]